MRVLLDGEPLPAGPAGTVREALSAAAAATEKSGRMIVEVSVDGAVWDQQQIHAELSGASGAEEVRLTSCDARELVIAAYRDAATALGEADALQREAADLIQADRRAEAMDTLNRAIQIWQSVQRAVLMGLQAEAVPAPATPLLERRLTDAIERLNRQLTIIRDALQCDDPVGVSDTLLYELPDVVHEWRSLLHELEAPLTA